MKAKLTFVSFFAVATLLAIPVHSQDFLKRIKPWLYPDDSLVALSAKRMQLPMLPFGGKNFGEKSAALFSNFSSTLNEKHSFSDSVEALWVRHYASGLIPVDDFVTATAVDDSGNIYVTGYSYSSTTSYDYVTIKYNTSGVEQWVKRYNGPVNSNDRAVALAMDAAGNVYVTGYSEASRAFINYDYATIKYNASGVEQWVARYDRPGNSYNDDSPSTLAVDVVGNVYVTGYSRDSNTFVNYDYATIKYNAYGVEQWVARYDGPGNSDDYATALAMDGSGNVYVTGYSSGGSSTSDYATIKYNPSGVEQWVSRYNAPGNFNDRAIALAVDAAGNVYVTGSSQGSSTFIDYDYATIKYNTFGVEQWVTRYDGPENFDDHATAFAVDATGNVYVAGYSRGSSTFNDYATIKYDTFGVEQWVARYDGPENFDDIATALVLDATGNVYVTGYSRGSSTSNDYATIKYNPFGVEQWVASYDGPGNFDDNAIALAVDDIGNVYVAGSSKGKGSSTFNDYATIKYNPSGVEQWVARYDGPANSYDLGRALVVDPAGNVYVTGSSQGSSTSDDYVTIKYNASGVEQWVARYDGPRNLADYPTALALDASGNVYVTGYSGGSSTSDYATIKYNPSGVEQWVARYDGPGNFDDTAIALALDAAGNVYVTGSSNGSGNYDYVTVKYNAAGVRQWVVRYNGLGNSFDFARALAVDTAGNVYVTGYSRGSSTFDYATIKYNTSGVKQWVARDGPVSHESPISSVAVDATGNVYVTGVDYATIKYNAFGVRQWVAGLGGLARALAVDAAGNVYVTGYSQSSSTSTDYATIKYNAFGVQQWVARYDGPGNLVDIATALALDAGGNVYVTGYSQGSSTSDYATIKYNAFGVQQWVARYDGPENSFDFAGALAVDAARNVYVTGFSDSKTGSIYTTIKYLQARMVTTNSVTDVGATVATLIGTVNPNGLSTTVKFQYGTTTNYGSEVVASPSPVIGTTPVSVSVKIMDLIPDTAYHFRIVATNNTEILFGGDQIFKTLPCEPVTMLFSLLSFGDAGNNITVTVIFSGSGVCGVDSAFLKYRRGGDRNFSTATAIVSVDSLYRWTIPASMVTSQGVEYFIAAKDDFGLVTKRVPAIGVFSVRIDVPSGVKKEIEQPSGSEQNAYRLISMPLDLDNKSAKAVLEDNFGPYNKKKWRLFAMRPDSQAYVEFPDTLKMDSGKAFLLIVKDPGKVIDTGAGKSNRTDKPFSIVLHPRWNFVGNPFNFPIPLENLSVKSGKPFPLRYHEGTWRDPLLNKISEIKPFEGYAVFNTLDVADTLLINPDLSSSASSLAKEFASTIEEKMQWSIRILAQCQEAFDEDNRAAIVSGASSNWDDLDQPEPPVIGEYVSAYFPHPKWNKLAKNYCTDVSRPEKS